MDNRNPLYDRQRRSQRSWSSQAQVCRDRCLRSGRSVAAYHSACRILAQQ